MKITIRENTFETNSSSTHAFSIKPIADFPQCEVIVEIEGSKAYETDVVARHDAKAAYLLLTADAIDKLDEVFPIVEKTYIENTDAQIVVFKSNDLYGPLNIPASQELTDKCKDEEFVKNFIFGDGCILREYDEWSSEEAQYYGIEPYGFDGVNQFVLDA